MSFVRRMSLLSLLFFVSGSVSSGRNHVSMVNASKPVPFRLLFPLSLKRLNCSIDTLHNIDTVAIIGHGSPKEIELAGHVRSYSNSTCDGYPDTPTRAPERW